MTDMLQDMFDKQHRLQVRLKPDIQSQEYINLNVLAITDELHEFLRETPWKPWKKIIMK